jgi:hypothetical protein
MPMHRYSIMIDGETAEIGRAAEQPHCEAAQMKTLLSES